jgi:hypothetical protein
MENEIREKESIPIPATLDIIKFNGRWAQALTPFMIRFLNDQSIINDIQWDNYIYHKPLGIDDSAGGLLMSHEISEGEFDAIYYDADNRNNRYLKGLVKYFGEYTNGN